MYLTDHDIKALSDEMTVTGPNQEHPFEPERQIQPCSIHKRVGQIENADQVLSDFARREKRRRLIDNATLTTPVLFGGAALAGVFVPFGLWLIVFIVLFAASLIAAFMAYERRDDGYLGPSELHAIEQRPSGPAS